MSTLRSWPLPVFKSCQFTTEGVLGRQGAGECGQTGTDTTDVCSEKYSKIVMQYNRESALSRSLLSACRQGTGGGVPEAGVGNREARPLMSPGAQSFVEQVTSRVSPKLAHPRPSIPKG